MWFAIFHSLYPFHFCFKLINCTIKVMTYELWFYWRKFKPWNYKIHEYKIVAKNKIKIQNKVLRKFEIKQWNWKRNYTIESPHHHKSSLAINSIGRKTLLHLSILVQLIFYPTITKQTVAGYQPSISILSNQNQHQFCMAIIRIFWMSQIHHWFAKYVEAFDYQWNDITSFFA